MYQAILFDMDGTLLPMDQETFVKVYFGALCKRFAPKGYEPSKLIDTIWSGTKAMVTNDGSCSNEQRFWDVFSAVFGKESLQSIPEFDDFYTREFIAAKDVTTCNPLAAQCIALLKDKGYPLVLATNPIFPMVAQKQRLSWAGLKEEDFLHITAYENSCHCKPNPDYYRDIMNTLSLDPAECLMVGNDVGEDMIAERLGMQVFLLTDCIINKANEDISKYPHGNFDDLTAFLLQACGISDTAHDEK